MTKEQVQQVLDELQGVRPEMLNGEAKRLFEAIMKIADERDKIEQEYDRDTHILQNQLDLANAENIKKDKQIERYQNILATNDMLHIKESQEKDKVIDLMSEFLNKRSWREHQLKEDTCYCCNVDYGADDCKDCIKQYFENKAKELLNK